VAGRPAEEVYRPVSGWAIAGLGLSGFFAVFLVVNAIIALVKGTPFLLPSWLLLVAAGGVALSFFARWWIRKSEGTRAGLALTTWGIRLGILFGLGYGAYALATDMAVRRQATEFLTEPGKGFFAKLKTPGEVNAAFLLTRPPDLREGVNPNQTDTLLALYKGALTTFWDSNIVRIAQQGGEKTQIEVVSVKSPEYREGGYWVGVEAQITTPYFALRTPLVVRSEETPTGRQWYVDWTKTPGPQDLYVTREGERIENVLRLSHQFASAWANRLLSGGLKPKDFRPRGDGLDLSRVRSAKVSEVVRQELARLMDPSAPERLQGMVDFLCCERSSSREGRDRIPVLAYWEVNPQGRLEVAHELRLRLGDPVRRQRPPLSCMGKLIVERTGPDAGTFKNDDRRPPTWRIVRLEITRAQQISVNAKGRGRPGQ
jgi:hypothetical protein